MIEATNPTSRLIVPSTMSTTTVQAKTHASTSWTGAPGEFRPPRYASPQEFLPSGEPYPTAGRYAGRWIQRNLVHGEGDYLGEKIRLRLFQWFLLNRIYEFDPDTGRLLHDTVLLVISKGNGKTESCGELSNVEMQSDLAPLRSPKVTLSAASWKQADELLNAAQLAITGSDMAPGPLAPKFQRGLHLLDDKIIAPNGGRIVRLAAVGGTADGGKETCHICDEIHEYVGARAERMWTVKGRSLRKRVVIRGLCARCLEPLVARTGKPPAHRDRTTDRDHVALPIRGGLQIGITTVGDDPTVVTEDPATLLGRLWRKGVDIAEGKVVDPRFLFLAWQAEEGLDLDNERDLEQAILQANPAAGTFVSVDEKKRSINDSTVPRAEGERYDLGWWSQATDSWMPVRSWVNRRHKAGLIAPPKGTKVWLGFDGSKSRDSTALWGCTADGHIFKVAAWEKPINGPAGWQVPKLDVMREIHAAFAWFDVQTLQPDPPRWEQEIEELEAAYPGRIIRFETDVYQRFAPACGRFSDAVLGDKPTITHDGDPTLTRHIANARQKETRWGVVITKEHKDSPRKIDAAVAAVLAHDGATNPVETPPSKRAYSW
jgi:phage terminase large subunit-like protein